MDKRQRRLSALEDAKFCGVFYFVGGKQVDQGFEDKLVVAGVAQGRVFGVPAEQGVKLAAQHMVAADAVVLGGDFAEDCALEHSLDARLDLANLSDTCVEDVFVEDMAQVFYEHGRVPFLRVVITNKCSKIKVEL